MGNMSYCQFENTFRDLQQCEDALNVKEFSELSESEQKYRNKLIELCKQIAENFEVEEEE